MKKLLAFLIVAWLAIAANANAETTPLCFTAKEAGATICLTKEGSPSSMASFEISTDAAQWQSYTLDTDITLDAVGSKVYFRNASDSPLKTFSGDYRDYFYFKMGEKKIAASGNVMSLMDKSCKKNYCCPVNR